MKCLSLFVPGHKKAFWAVLFCLLLVLPGCSLKEMQRQTEVVENAGYIQGTINVTSNQKGPVIVLRFRDENNIPVKESRTIASKKGEYSFPVIAGPYYIAAFIDTNNDNTYQPEEHGNIHGHPTIINVAPRQTVTLEELVIAGPVTKLDSEVKAVDRTAAAYRNIGEVVTMDDPRFTRDYYNLGLWKPFNFLKHAEGGLFFLKDFQEDKVPILFVHGVLDGPTLWKEVIENLDKQHFQPWLLYYPTGMRLELISDYLVTAVEELQNKHGFNQFYVVAHSMGGLVTRSFVKKFIEHSPGNVDRLGMVMTINSPMNGMAAAASGVRNSPIVVPSWRDVEPGSQFLNKIHTWNWPEEIPYHLVISYRDGDSGDGVVALQSQAQPGLQSESTRMYIFNNDHVGTLSNKDFQAMLNKVLAKQLGK